MSEAKHRRVHIVDIESHSMRTILGDFFLVLASLGFSIILFRNKTFLLHLIDWAYTKNVRLDQKNVEKLLPIADRLQFIDLLNKCCDFLAESLSIQNVIGIRRFAMRYFCNRLKESSQNFLMYEISFFPLL